jgi:threonine/homoserine/homoserine lactone efflux protein
MYTPGPVTITATNFGLRKQLKQGFPFYFGISLAIFTHYMIFGYFGTIITGENTIFFISLIGSIYMFYLGIKMFKSNVVLKNNNQISSIGFKEGYFMQLFNPKAAIAVIPVVTIYFPTYHIFGMRIFFMAIFFMILVIGSPLSYAFLGQTFSSFIKNSRLINIFTKLMSLILIYISFSIFYHYVILSIFK